MRGSERIVHDIAISLRDRGHEVTILTSHRERSAITTEEGVEVIRSWRPPGVPALRWYEDLPGCGPGLAWNLRRVRYDVVHSFHPMSAWTAARARPRGGPPLIFSFHGIPDRPYLVARRYRLEMIREVVDRSDAVSVLSAAASGPFARYLLRAPEILPAGVLGPAFSSSRHPIGQPTLFCAADLRDARKRGPLLMEAFGGLRSQIPDARLVLAAAGRHVPLARPLPPGVEMMHGDSTDKLTDAYSAASVSVLPAVHEALGLVMLESLAAGTPVVAARSGAGPSIINSASLGRLFEPDDLDSLVVALKECLALSTDPRTDEVCRKRAGEFSWSRLIVLYEDLYRRLLSPRRR